MTVTASVSQPYGSVTATLIVLMGKMLTHFLDNGRIALKFSFLLAPMNQKIALSVPVRITIFVVDLADAYQQPGNVTAIKIALKVKMSRIPARIQRSTLVNQRILKYLFILLYFVNV